MMLSLDTAYRSFGGEVEASSTPTICRLPDSRRHQLSAIALISKTTSCAGVRNWAMTTKQCGVCSQCIERRFAVLAAELGAHEPADSYSVELFTGAHTKP